MLVGNIIDLSGLPNGVAFDLADLPLIAGRGIALSRRRRTTFPAANWTVFLLSASVNRIDFLPFLEGAAAESLPCTTKSRRTTPRWRRENQAVHGKSSSTGLRSRKRLSISNQQSTIINPTSRLDQVRLVVESQQHRLVEDQVLRKPAAMGFGEPEVLVAELLDPPGAASCDLLTCESTHWPLRRKKVRLPMFRMFCPADFRLAVGAPAKPTESAAAAGEASHGRRRRGGGLRALWMPPFMARWATPPSPDDCPSALSRPRRGRSCQRSRGCWCSRRP